MKDVHFAFFIAEWGKPRHEEISSPFYLEKKFCWDLVNQNILWLIQGMTSLIFALLCRPYLGQKINKWPHDATHSWNSILACMHLLTFDQNKRQNFDLWKFSHKILANNDTWQDAQHAECKCKRLPAWIFLDKIWVLIGNHATDTPVYGEALLFYTP